ncbi:MAG: primosomal protein N' [Desulfopila sp.]
MLLEIAVAAPIDQSLTYRLPSALVGAEDRLDAHLVGRRVLVPLGRRKVTGYILADDGIVAGEFKLREVEELLDERPLFPPSLVPLFRWIASYYHYPLGEVIRSALPAGLSPQSVQCLELTVRGEKDPDGSLDALAEKWRKQLRRTGSLSAAATRELLRSGRQRGIVRRLVAEDLLCLHTRVTSDVVREKQEVCYRLGRELPAPPATGDEEPERIADYRGQLDQALGAGLKLSEAKTLFYLQGLQAGSADNSAPRKELLELYAGAGNPLRSLLARNLVIAENRRIFRSPLGERLDFFPPPDSLTEGQQQVLAEIIPAITKGGYAPFLLHGVTGSGKTEVYLQAAAVALARQRSVLVIVPEIALATQLEAHFVSRFGDQVVLLHSGLTAAERFDQWSLALEGKGKIVIGARSAVFAPLAEPGLIIVDEEHDGGLKQDDKLRYNGRDLAVVRARQQQAVVLLASATPSVVSYHNALTGKYRLLTMEHRVNSRPLPRVTLIDLRQQSSAGKRGLFRPQLAEALKKNLARGGQSVVLLNRRGYSSNVICQECGMPVQCRDCHVTLTLHRTRQQLLCHYCGYHLPEKTVCENCGSTRLVTVGFGTERVEDELGKLMPTARIARLDTDTARDRTVFLRTLKLMRAREIDVLVGTQMVAKGHHFPGVTLVGVVWADGGLSIPDYRAAEKTFQLISQVTGRAGRGDAPGEVFIQTMRPEHYAIDFARSHSYRQLVEKELELRRNPSFPPFVRLVVLHIQGESEQEVERSAGRVAGALRATVAGAKMPVEILGPAPSPIDRLKKKYRWQVMIKSGSVDLIDGICRHLRARQSELVAGSCRLLLDRDPENML